MARIKKKGLDYFPLNTDFIHDRAVRRLMKRGGDSALGILVEVLSYIYAGEGYYVRADRLFYEDLSAGLYENSADDVERIIRLAVEYGLFDAGLFERERILTSAEIQRQYLFSTRRRNVPGLEVAYSLLTVEESVENKEDTDENTLSCCANQGDGEDVSAVENVTFIPENVTSGTHSIAQHSIAQQSKKDPLLSPPLRKTGEEGKRKRGKEEVFSETSCGRDAARHSVGPSAGSSASSAVNGLAASSSGEDSVRHSVAPPVGSSASSGSAVVNALAASSSARDAVRHSAAPPAAGGLFANPCGGGESQSPAACVKGDSGSGKRKIWTQEAIDRLLPPADGTPRNYAGLLDNLRIYGIPPAEQYAIIRKSNFGAIGGSIWKGIAALRGSGGKIKLPGRYLLSVVNRRDDEAAS
ncbi:hypothetical protein IX307_000890 [Bacteroides pyogenes]|uniref:DUF4373 domain-containing protein n=2 Tax=Bacteroides pyogenes TaxID=310300 RepID=UPI001ED7BF01|nr:DUF4373 domain-containing protein [Bacteroides pyogenes]MBR8719577.1 hypothetical protein [Bacteroides pyogenes]MBR8786581.1 hypothetical protein [Bacteroides pyogenes]MBR8792064.1 hypothetical protein [Bacteroides pyogenes]